MSSEAIHADMSPGNTRCVDVITFILCPCATEDQRRRLARLTDRSPGALKVKSKNAASPLAGTLQREGTAGLSLLLMDAVNEGLQSLRAMPF